MEEKNRQFTEIEKNTEVRAALVGVELGDGSAESQMEELVRLLETAGGTAAVRMIQTREKPDVRTCIGSGKLAELKELCVSEEVTLAVFDTDLTPSQIRNLEDALETVDVIDRSMLILDIFARHATTAEGKLQVELAQLKYTAPRLIGKGKQLSRLGGGIGTRGPGESKLETDRRHLARRVAMLEAELQELDRTRMTMRAARDRSGLKKAAIVGYTNAGKSTLLNRMTDAGILAEDKLFATLDPTTRKFTLPSGAEILLTDTVGFIRALPHHLIKAFKSTLDEAVCADILIVVIDATDREYVEQLSVTENLLAELGAAGKPTLYLFNKCDLPSPNSSIPRIRFGTDAKDVFYLSAATGEGMEAFCARLEELALSGSMRVTFRVPHARADVIAALYREAEVSAVTYLDDVVQVDAVADEKTRGRYSAFLAEGQAEGDA